MIVSRRSDTTEPDLMKHLRLSIPLALVAALSGCTEDTVPTVQTDVDKDEPVAELDDTTEAELCEDLEEFAQEFYNADLFTKIECISIGALAGVNLETGQLDEGACQRAYDECLRNPPQTEDSFEIEVPQTTCDVTDIPPECSDLTVGDVVGCVEEAAQFLDEYVNNFSCSKLGEASMQTTVGAACESVADKCPTLFEDAATDSGSSEPPPAG